MEQDTDELEQAGKLPKAAPSTLPPKPKLPKPKAAKPKAASPKPAKKKRALWTIRFGLYDGVGPVRRDDNRRNPASGRGRADSFRKFEDDDYLSDMFKTQGFFAYYKKPGAPRRSSCSTRWNRSPGPAPDRTA